MSGIKKWWNINWWNKNRWNKNKWNKKVVVTLQVQKKSHGRPKMWNKFFLVSKSRTKIKGKKTFYSTSFYSTSFYSAYLFHQDIFAVGVPTTFYSTVTCLHLHIVIPATFYATKFHSTFYSNFLFCYDLLAFELSTTPPILILLIFILL